MDYRNGTTFDDVQPHDGLFLHFQPVPTRMVLLHRSLFIHLIPHHYRLCPDSLFLFQCLERLLRAP